MSLSSLRSSMEWALMVALILGGGAIAQAQNGQAADDASQQPLGKIVRIGPAGDSDVTIVGDADDDAQIQLDGPPQLELPKHWIGLLGGPVSDELRAQIDIPTGQGVLVRQVVPGSPADKAGLKVFDILLRANDTNLTDVADLTELVRSQGESGGQIALDVLRRGQHETIAVTPATRPESPVTPFGRRGGPMQFRMFRPGMALSQPGLGLSQMPNGVSVSIQKENDEPAHITVQRGNDTWHIVGDDPASLAQLPDDVRPFVEQLLAGGGRMQLPAMPVMPSPPGFSGVFNDDAMQQLQRMEQQLRQMQLMLEHGIEQPHVEDRGETDTE